MRVAIIGGGQGGLATAVELAAKGHQVVVFESREIVGGKAAPVTQEGYRMDPGPSIVILPQIYAESFRRAGRRMEDYLSFDRLPEITRVILEGEGTYDLPGDRAAALELVRGLDEDDARSLELLLKKLDTVIGGVEGTIFTRSITRPWQLMDPRLIRFGMRFDVRRTYKETIDGWFRHPLLRAFFYGFPSYGGQGYHSKAPGALTIPYYMLTGGVFWPKLVDGSLEGIAAIPAAFERLARELGATIRTGEPVLGIERQNGRVTGVHLRSGFEPFDAVVSNRDRFSAATMLDREEAREPSYSYYTHHWGVPRRLEGLAHHTLLIPKEFERGFEALYDRREFPDPPIVYLNDTTVTDPTTAPPGGTNLFAVVTCPSDEPHIDWANPTAQREAVARTMGACGHPMPEDAVFERVQTPLTFASRDGSYRGSLYGVDERHRILGGTFPLGLRDEELKNLFYVGGAVQPGAGLPMVTLGGRFVAEMIGR